MKEHFSMKDIVSIFNLPKSTIAFWEKKQLIRPHRDETNNYRVYTLKDIVDISDIAFYRNMGVSLNALKNIKEFSKDELETVVDETSARIDEQLAQLNASKQELNIRKMKLAALSELEQETYSEGVPPFAELTSLAFAFDPEKASFFFAKGPYNYGVVISEMTTLNFKEGFIKDSSMTDHAIIWQRQDTCNYKRCLLKIAVEDTSIHNLQTHLDYFKDHNLTMTSLVATYLATFKEDQLYDYYEAWLEYQPTDSF